MDWDEGDFQRVQGRLGVMVRRERQQRGWTTYTLAERLGYGDHTAITRLEQGQLNITLRRLVGIVRLLNLSLDEIMHGGEYRRRRRQPVAAPKFVPLRGEKARKPAPVDVQSSVDAVVAMTLEESLRSMCATVAAGLATVTRG